MLRKLFLISLLYLISHFAFAANVNKIVFFGDSLSDNGNLYQKLLQIIPKSPPYYKGRFSNGPTWAEHVGDYYYKKRFMDYKIYAYGGATAAVYLPSFEHVSPTILSLEVSHYLLDALFQDKDDVLFSIWIGGNDYLYHQDGDLEYTTDRVVGRINKSIVRLINHGAKHFLILNLPDLSNTPFAGSHGSKSILHTLSMLHNEKLEQLVKELQKKYQDVSFTFINVHDLLNEMITNPSKYNDKYHVTIKNTSDACWQGKYTLKAMLSNKSLASEIKQTLLTKNVEAAQEIDPDTVSKIIAASPSLAEAYRVGKMYELGIKPCANPDEYLFWDQIHPTEIMHTILARIVIEKLDSERM